MEYHWFRIESGSCLESTWARVRFLSSHPLLRLKGDIHEGLEVVETERSAVAPGTGLILDWSRKVCRKERSLLADILPDRGLDIATSQRRRRSAVAAGDQRHQRTAS